MSLDDIGLPLSDSPEQLFILGAPRSGTTFLASLLGSSRYGTPVESQFVTKYFLRLKSYGDLTIFKNFKKLLSDIASERAVMQWNLDLDAIKLHGQLLNHTGNVQYADLVNLIFKIRRITTNQHAWGDKTPHYLGDIDILDHLFPNARYLYIVRDGRDVALSLLRKDWGPNNLYTAAEYWTALNKINPTLEHLEATGRLYFLRYEDLSQDVEFHVRRICNFLEEEISDREVSRLSKTVQKNNSYKWRQALSQRKVQLFETVARDTLIRFGYCVGPERKPPPFFTRRVYHFHDRILWLLFMFKTNVIHSFQIRFLGKEPFAD